MILWDDDFKRPKSRIKTDRASEQMYEAKLLTIHGSFFTRSKVDKDDDRSNDASWSHHGDTLKAERSEDVGSRTHVCLIQPPHRTGLTGYL